MTLTRKQRIWVIPLIILYVIFLVFLFKYIFDEIFSNDTDATITKTEITTSLPVAHPRNIEILEEWAARLELPLEEVVPVEAQSVPPTLQKPVVVSTTLAPPPPPSPPPPPPEPVVEGQWQVAEASWYGPGFYGNNTACGQYYTKEIVGVAHLELPCGTMVTFRHNGVVVEAPVIDRGPYVKDRMWDLSHGLCQQLNHCHTGDIEWYLS